MTPRLVLQVGRNLVRGWQRETGDLQLDELPRLKCGEKPSGVAGKLKTQAIAKLAQLSIVCDAGFVVASAFDGLWHEVCALQLDRCFMAVGF